MLILDALRSTLLACVVFGLVPILWWGIKGRKAAPFKETFGLTWRRPDGRSAARALAAYGAIWAGTHLPVFTQYTQPSASAYLGLGAPAVIPIVIVSFLQTGFLEEFLFRGFVGKRLVGAFGYRVGIPLQAAIFGGLHLLLASDVTPLSGAIIFATTAIGGFLLGYLAERPFKGSILPGALLHGLGNFIVNACQAFS